MSTSGTSDTGTNYQVLGTFPTDIGEGQVYLTRRVSTGTGNSAAGFDPNFIVHIALPAIADHAPKSEVRKYNIWQKRLTEAFGTLHFRSPRGDKYSYDIRLGLLGPPNPPELAENHEGAQGGLLNGISPGDYTVSVNIFYLDSSGVKQAITTSFEMGRITIT